LTVERTPGPKVVRIRSRMQHPSVSSADSAEHATADKKTPPLLSGGVLYRITRGLLREMTQTMTPSAIFSEL
ncbi:MAG: hypothetical protein KAU35_04060, partial [candidate division Zixibacteria bacterium]|nr:hypothetical protein [candidate division Zixibacteria bacterium]